MHNGECGHVAVRPPGYVHVAGQPGGHELEIIYRKCRIPKGSPVIVFRLSLFRSVKNIGISAGARKCSFLRHSSYLLCL